MDSLQNLKNNTFRDKPHNIQKRTKMIGLKNINDYFSTNELNPVKIQPADFVRSCLLILGLKHTEIEKIMGDENAPALVRRVARESLLNGDKILMLILEKMLQKNIQLDITSGGLPLADILQEIEKRQTERTTIIVE